MTQNQPLAENIQPRCFQIRKSRSKHSTRILNGVI